MRLLVDTQLAIWWLTHAARVPAYARELISDSAETVAVSRASLWEMAIKNSLGKLRIDLARFVAEVERTGFTWLDIRNDHLLAVAELPPYEDHKDPFDRLIVAQSLSEPMLLLTADVALARYGSTVRVVR